MAFAPSASWNSRSITHLANYPSPSLPMIFSDESYIQSIVGDTCGGSMSSPCAPLGNANWYLYYEGLHAPFASHYPFYDITAGCNNNDITQQYGLNAFCAGPGYDLVTGWGSGHKLAIASGVEEE